MADPNPAYVIESVLDFLAVPKGRLPECLSEFAAFLGLARAIKDGDDGNSIALRGLKFIWCDDGEPGVTEVRVSAESPDGSVETVEVKIR